MRILDFPYGSSDVLIEKQLNAVTFEIIDNGQLPVGSTGLVELAGTCEVFMPDDSALAGQG